MRKSDAHRRRLRQAADAASRRRYVAPIPEDAIPTPAPPPVAPPAPRCDRSADAGSTHLWPPDAQVGDYCLCGKRRRFTPVR